eukprot:jgi/Astpho2/2225/Aster-03207
MSVFTMGALQAALPCTIPRPRAAAAPQMRLMPQYQGMARSQRLGVSFPGCCTSNSMSLLPQNGSLWFAMRHGVRKARLGRPADQRKALLRGLVTELIRHGKIRTTKIKAKAMRKPVDKMIGLAKRGTLHARRQAQAYIYDKDLVANLFEGAPERFAQRQCGFTRITAEIQLRRGDAAEMAVIEFVD